MLHQLHIQNYAIIENLEINFSSRLNIITGETGAGKSILMGALSLVLGERSNASILFNKEKKCIIEAHFKSRQPFIKDFFEHNDLDVQDEITVRREILPNGKSRAFVNDTPVNLTVLQQLSARLVDLHQQFDTADLNSNDFQREVIDTLAGNANALNVYQLLYKSYVIAKQQLADLKEAQQIADKEFDYNNYLFTELEEAGYAGNELETLGEELKVISNAESIKDTLTNVFFELQESEHPLVQQLKSLNNQLSSLRNFHSDITVLIDRLHSTQIELQDIADEVGRLNNAVFFDAEKINSINEKLANGYRLLKKHGVTTTAELLAIRTTLEGKLQKANSISEAISSKENEINTNQAELKKMADKISSKRAGQLEPFQDKVNNLLAQVGMPNARIKVQLQQSQVLNAHGSDALEFLFDANKSARFEPLRKVASGGELSRLMLGIKSLVAKSMELPTLIFDEIDTGISGEAARQVGIIMKGLSTGHQVIAITHQPQIAAKADAHYFVYKEIKGDSIVTAVKLLNKDERITAIATMLSGERPTAAAFENAREMIGN